MMWTIRYYWNRKEKRLVVNPKGLAMALQDKAAEVANVVHWDSADGWEKALSESIELIHVRFLSGIWAGATLVCLSLLGCFLFWWLPMGQRVKLEEAFWVILMLFAGLALFWLFGTIRNLVLMRRLPGLLARMRRADIVLSCKRIPSPVSLLAETEPPKVRRIPALISLVVFLLWMAVGNITVPLPRTKVLIHRRNGETNISTSIQRLSFGDWWELIPRYITGETYGLVYFNEGEKEVVVFAVEYKVDNDKDYAPSMVHQRIGTWALNLGQHFSSLARGGMPVGLSQAEEAEYYKQVFGDSRVLDAFGKQIRDAAEEILEERLVSIDVEVSVVSLSDYQKKMRKYYD